MEIRIDGRPVGTTTRTPGHDYELAVGRCLVEGLLHGRTVHTVRYCGTGSAAETGFNVVTVETAGPDDVAVVPMAPSCGWSGSDLIDDQAIRNPPLPSALTVAPALLAAVASAVADGGDLVGRTGAGHVAAAFDASGAVDPVREDLDAANAVDKVVGRLVLDGRRPAAGIGLCTTGPADFRLVQQAWAAGCTVVLAGSPATSLAVDTAGRAGIVLAWTTAAGSVAIGVEH